MSIKLNLNKYSFIELIKVFKIQIPILQRDYVQGRTTEAVKDIRENFVSDLVDHISEQTDKVLPLDFIYGYAEEESGKYDREVSKKNIETLLSTIRNYSSLEHFDLFFTIKDQNNLEKNLFIPLDGQQRLTTLFLLHFYVAFRHNADLVLPIAGKLTYKTRKSSDQFCSAIVFNAKELDTSKAIADAIEDSAWFLTSWKRDPTVEGMLVMLQEIERKFESLSNVKVKLEHSYKNLFLEPKIFFDFLNINEQGLADDIYLKMNSTGKALSDYDNFKSWFVTQVASLLKDTGLVQDDAFVNWQDNLDQKWYNLFWKEDPIHADELMYAFIRSILGFKILLQKGEEGELKEKYDKIDAHGFLPLKFYEENKLITLDNVRFLFSLFQELCLEESSYLLQVSEIWTTTFSTGNTFQKTVLTKLGELSLLHKVFIYSASLLINRKAQLPLNSFRKLARVFRNITYNTRIDDFSRFLPAIKSLNQFLAGESSLTITNEKWIESFDGKQVKEEYKKLALENEANFLEVESIENHHYLYGQILFILQWSLDENGIIDMETLLHYKKRFFNLFSMPNLNNENFPVQQILLCYTHCWMPNKGSSRFSFCKNTYGSARERDENWRILFESEHSIIKTVLDDLDCSDDTLTDEISIRYKLINDWRRYFLNDPSLIAKCGQRMINHMNDGDFIRLLDKTKLNGYHTELRTWVLYLQLKETFNINDTEIKYHYVDSAEQDSRIEFPHSNVFVKYDRGECSLVFQTFKEDKGVFEEIDGNNVLHHNITIYIKNFNLRKHD